MIVRVLSATLKAERAGVFNELMRTQLPILRTYPGLRYVKLCRRIRGAEQELLLFVEWQDTASPYGWGGPRLRPLPARDRQPPPPWLARPGPALVRPRLLPGAEDLVLDLRVAHYEALDMDLDP